MSISYEKSNVNFVPAKPPTSRFVAPWDTSGWYYVSPNMNVGSKIYSNSDAVIASIDEKYVGADYIVTFNSAADGFDDKQEVDFFAERDITVFVALVQHIAHSENNIGLLSVDCFYQLYVVFAVLLVVQV